jgi:hypothetical protein
MNAAFYLRLPISFFRFFFAPTAVPAFLTVVRSRCEAEEQSLCRKPARGFTSPATDS